MDAKKVKSMLSDRDVYSLLEDLNAEPMVTDNVWTCKTICHCGDSHKLYYYRETKNFHCYTSCGSMDIFSLVEKVLEVEFYESVRYIMNKFNIEDDSDAISVYNVVDNPSDYFRNQMRTVDFPKIKILSDNILNCYYNMPHISWLKDGISVRSMMKYNIGYSILDNKIIIPHKDKKGNLIGVRSRNLNKDLVESGKKYMPIFHNGRVLKHPTGANLYGLYENKESIEKYRTAILFESEKSVLQLDTMLPDMSIGLCVSGSSLTDLQLELLKDLEIDEVIIATDKEFDEKGDILELAYAKKIRSVFGNRLTPFYRVSVLWDMFGVLDKKDSPTDKGLDIFKKLMDNRIYL